MNKRKSIIKLSLIVGALLVAIVLTFLQTPGILRYMGTAGAVKKHMGAESQGGAVLVYKAAQPRTSSRVSYGKQLDARMQLMRVALAGDQNQSNNLITDRKHVARQGSNKIRVESPNASSTQQVEQRIDLGYRVAFNDASGEVAPNSGAFIRNINFRSRASSQSYIIEIDLTDEGRKALEESSRDIFIVDGTGATIESLSSDIFNENGKVTGRITIRGSDANELHEKYTKILAGSRPLILTLVSADMFDSLRADTAAILAMCAGLAAAVLICAFLIIRYRLLGAAAAVSFLSAFALLIFFAAVLPFSSLSFLGISMITLIMFLNAGTYILSFENIKEEFKKGKSVQASIAAGYKRTLWPLIDIHLFAAVVGAGLWILGEGAAASAGMIIVFASILSMGAATVMCKYLIKLTVGLWGEDSNPAHFALKRPAGFKETDIIADELEKAERTGFDDEEADYE